MKNAKPKADESCIDIELTGKVYVVSYEGGKKHRTEIPAETVLALLEMNIQHALSYYLTDSDPE